MMTGGIAILGLHRNRKETPGGPLLFGMVPSPALSSGVSVSWHIARPPCIDCLVCRSAATSLYIRDTSILQLMIRSLFCMTVVQNVSSAVRCTKKSMKCMCMQGGA